jgi:hypothetical protein
LLASYFVIPSNQSGKWSIIVLCIDKCELATACIALRVVGIVLDVFLRHSPPANGKQGPIPEEMSQTLLTNKKQGNPDEVHASNIIKSTQTRIDGEKYTF